MPNENVNVLQTLIQFRRGTEEQWNLVKDSYIPRAGEPCTTIDGDNAGQIKVGDGVHTWGQLKYVGVGDLKVIKIYRETVESTETTVDGKTYATVEEAIADAPAGSEVILSGSLGDNTVNIDKELTVNMNGVEVVNNEKTPMEIGVNGKATLKDGFYTAGSAATWTGASYDAPTMGEATTGKFASEGIVATVGSGADEETLIFSAAGTADAVTAQGAFNAGNVNFGTFNGGSATVIDTTKFSGGSKTADTFVANELQSATTGKVSEVSAAALVNAPVFTGKRYSVSTTSDTALKDVAFTATNSATIVNKVEYVKPEVKSAVLKGEAATSTFNGTKVEKALVTGVKYDKADATAAFSVAVTPETKVITKTAKTVEVEVTPVAKGK